MNYVVYYARSLIRTTVTILASLGRKCADRESRERSEWDAGRRTTAGSAPTGI
jgi:hypothetical protein